MAVSCLSPVRIQIFISAFIRVSMVSGTLSWSLSSIAVAPSSCRFYSRIFFLKRQWEAITGKKMSLQHHVSEKHASQECVTHSAMFPFISCCLSRTKPPKGFQEKGVYVCVCLCVHPQTPPLLYGPRPYNTLFFGFFFFLSRNSGDSLVPVAGLYGAKTGSSIWQDPGVEGRHEPAAEEKPREAFETVTSARAAPVCSSAGPSSEKPHSTQSCACGGGQHH